MKKCCAFLVFLIGCLLFLKCGGITSTNQEQPKPAYSSGIKTTGWRNPSNILTHQNYSKVYVHNNQSGPSQYIITKEEKFQRIYPIYNAHSYGGKQPEQTQKVIEENSQIGLNWANRGHFATVVGGNLAATHNNRTVYKRKVSYKTIEVFEKCPEGATGSFVYFLSCNQFLNCWKGRGEVQTCAPGTLFNPKTLECDFPEKVECVTGRQNSLFLQGASRSQKSVIQATCPKEFSGLIPNYTDCSKFINCNNGQQTSMDCPPGTLFDTTQNVCNFPYLTTCFNGQSGDFQNGGAFGREGQSLLQQGQRQGQSVYNRFQQQSHLNGQQYASNQGQQQGQVQGLQYGVHQGQVHEQQHGLNQGQQQSQSQGQRYGFNQGQSFHGINQYGGQGQGGQGGQYHTTYSQTSQNQNCNPQTQACSTPSGQGQQAYGIQYSSGVHQQGHGFNRNDGQIHQYGSSGYSGQQNIDSKLDFDVGQQTTQGHTIHGTSNCNPQTQNCDSGASSHTYYRPSNTQNCNSQTQNCGQGSGINYQQVGQTIVPACDPRFQNCDRGPINIHQQASGQSYVPNCDPQTQNCGQAHGYGTTHVFGSGQSHLSGSTQRTTQTYGSGQQNFHRICNINDSNCQLNKTVTARKNREPRCPEGFQGITKHPGDCKKFLSCANGRTFIQDCAQGTLFNPSLGICDFPYNVNCPNDQTNEATTEYRDANTGSDWQDQYNQHAQKYGQNSGHGNIRAETTTTRPLYLPPHDPNEGSYNQGHVQGPNTQGHGQFPYNEGSNNQGHTTNDQAHSNQNQGSYNTGGIKTNSGVYVPWRTRTDQGSEVTVLQPLTPRPSHVTIVPSGTVVNRGEIGLVSRPTRGPIDASNKNSRDYGDVYDPNQGRSFSLRSTTPRSAAKWPPPFPSTDVNADYVFEYEDGEPVTLEPENVFRSDKKKKKKTDCGKGDFYCSGEMCISKTAVCDGHRDCDNGSDELDCLEYLKRFSPSKNSQLNILEDQRWINVSQATCALLCIRSTSFECRSFNYRKIDRTCFLSKLNVGLTGALRQYYPYDYYELRTASINCTLLFKCNNNKCITNHQLCDGLVDCDEREDEKNCKAEDFGYSLRLGGSNKPNAGRVEVTAFGKTGYICDDQFGIQDANVICRELGFQLGAAEVKGQSYYATDLTEKNTLYMIDDLDCKGNETTVIDCNFPGWGIHNCRDQEIAGLVCKTPQEKCGKGSWKCDTGNECIPYSFVCDGLFDCTDDSDEGVQHCEAPTELRLSNGTSNSEGRVEIKHHGIWGSICDDDFNEDAAKVVCKYFGFRGTSTVKKEAYFGPGEGPIWLDQVSCYGNETELRNCTHWNWGEHNCDHTEDVGVICSNEVEEVPLPRHSNINNERYSSRTALPANTCGFRKDNQFLENDLIHARVVGGSVADKGDYPWQAALRIKGKAQQSHHWCGAVILSSQWVLTAAHCLLGYSKGAYMIVAGEYNTDEVEGTEQTKYIEEFFIHDNFTESTRVMKNDIALIKVKGVGFRLNEDVQPICLPDGDANYENELNCTISGFGSVKAGNSAYSHNMMAAWVPIIRTDICKMPHVYDTAMSEGMICAGFLSGGIDSCHGDSGGPLACLHNGLFTLYGITSWGHRCGFANKPGVYVKVAHYKKWIDDTMKNHS